MHWTQFRLPAPVAFGGCLRRGYLCKKEGAGLDRTVSHDVFGLVAAFRISRGSRTEAHVLTVQIKEDGHQGWGECVPYARYGESLQSVGAQIEGLPVELTRTALQELLPSGAARNAVDCALWDLEAKRTGKPVWYLAGLSRPCPEITAYTLSLDSPENMQRTRRPRHRHGLGVRYARCSRGELAVSGHF